MASSSWETILDSEFDTEDQALGTTVMLAQDGDSLSKLLIMDYFTSDGPQIRRLDSGSYETERDNSDESSGDEELRESGEYLANIHEVHGMESTRTEEYQQEVTDAPVYSLCDLCVEQRTQGTAQNNIFWEIVVSVLVVLLALVNCVWMWFFCGL